MARANHDSELRLKNSPTGGRTDGQTDRPRDGRIDRQTEALAVRLLPSSRCHLSIKPPPHPRCCRWPLMASAPHGSGQDLAHLRRRPATQVASSTNYLDAF